MGAWFSSPSTMRDHTIVSAPGKVLLAGGYLVLDRLYTGLVVATSSRFFASVRPTTAPCPSGIARVRVRAGQFPASPEWSYTVSEAGVEGADAASQKNKFIFLTLDNVLRYVQAKLHATGRDGDFERLMGGGLDVVVLADNDFYTQREQVSRRVCAFPLSRCAGARCARPSHACRAA
jgi:phosphomevalonate kinase